MAERLSHRRILAIALPIVASNATVPILGVVDTGVVGQLGRPEPIGAVGLGAVILTSVYWIFGFLRMGTTGLAAQAAGAGDGDEVSALLSRALLIAGGAGAALIVLQWPLIAAALAIAPASDEVERLAGGYMAIRILSAPAAIAVFGITGWLIAAERARGVLAVQLWMNGANMVLDLVFVLGFGWGVRGVAVATFLSEWSGAALGLWLCRDAFARPAWRDAARVFDRARLAHMGRVNRDILIRSALLLMIPLSFMFVAARFGDVALAANQVLFQFVHVTAFALDGFAFAAEALVGRAYGAGNVAALRRAAGLASLWGGLGALLLALAFAVLGGAIIDIMTTAPGVRMAARAYLPWMVAAPILGLAPWMLDGVFIGATRSGDMRNMMILSAAIYAAAVAALAPVLGNHGLWAALLISYLARGLTLAARYPALEAAARARAG